MAKKQRRTGNRSHGGRPKSTGERSTGGRLKPVGPNPTVVAFRRALLGEHADLSKGENALDVAHQRGWLTEEQHRAAIAYASLYRRAGFDLPTMRTANLGEAEGEYAKEASRSGVFVDGASIRPNRDRLGDELAMDQLRAIWARLQRHELRVLNDLCIMPGTWPRWIAMRLAGLAIVDRDYVLLIAALTAVEIELDASKKSPDKRVQICQGRTAA